MVRGIFEIQLVACSYDAMLTFYRDVLGLPVWFTDERRGRVHFTLGTGQLILAREGSEQVLADWPGVPPRMYADGESTVDGPLRHGPVHFAFDVDGAQWQSIAERLGDHATTEVRGPLAWGSGFQSLYFRDPDGNCVELIREGDPA